VAFPGRLGKLERVLAGRRHGDDPVARLRERLADPDDSVDLAAEISAIEAQGFGWPEPIVDRAEAVYRLALAVGWEGALAIGDDVFEGWEVDLLGHALTVFAEADRDGDRRFLARCLGVLKE